MSHNTISPITAGLIRQGKEKYANPFDKLVGMSDFHVENNSSVCSASPLNCHSNIHGTTHGGWISTVLDASSVKAAYDNELNGLAPEEYGVTKEITIKFLKPVLLSESYKCIARTLERNRNEITSESNMISPSGEIVASARALIKAKTLAA